MHDGGIEVTRIRRAVADDWRAVGRLLDATGLPVADLNEQRLGNFLVAEQDAPGPDATLGIVGLEAFGSYGLLRSLVVVESARKTGLGRKLVAALEDEARQQGVQELWLLTIDADNFFAILDYAPAERSDAPPPIRRTREFSELCPGDAILMRKHL